MGTTNETIDQIIDHLEQLVDAGETDPYAYTLSGIMERTDLQDVQAVSKALHKLEESEDIESRRMSIKVHVPRSTQARVVYEQLAERGYETFRPYLSVLLGSGLAYLILLGIGGPASETPSAAWQDGFVSAVFLGLAFGAVIQKILSRIARWKLKSKDAYATIVQLTTVSLLVGALVLGAYHLAISHFEGAFDPGVAVALVSLAFAVTIGYTALLNARNSHAATNGRVTRKAARPTPDSASISKAHVDSTPDAVYANDASERP